MAKEVDPRDYLCLGPQTVKSKTGRKNLQFDPCVKTMYSKRYYCYLHAYCRPKDKGQLAKALELQAEYDNLTSKYDEAHTKLELMVAPEKLEYSLVGHIDSFKSPEQKEQARCLARELSVLENKMREIRNLHEETCDLRAYCYTGRSGNWCVYSLEN